MKSIYFYRADAHNELARILGGKVPYRTREFQAMPLAPFRWVADVEEENLREATAALDDAEVGYWLPKPDREDIDA